MIRYRWDLFGPEPPATVTAVAVGPWSPLPTPWPRGLIWTPLHHWYRLPCTPQRCGDGAHYHWTNGDKTRQWEMLVSRAEYADARDLKAYSRLRRMTRARRLRRHRR